MGRKRYIPEQIIRHLRQADVLSAHSRCDQICDHMKLLIVTNINQALQIVINNI